MVEGLNPLSGGGWKAPNISYQHPTIAPFQPKRHTTIRVLGDVPGLGVDDSLNKRLEILVLGEQLVQVSKLVACVA